MVKEVKHRSRRVAALLAIVFVGMFGAHKFYIGNKQAGVIHIIVLFVAAFLSNAIGIELPMAFSTACSSVLGLSTRSRATRSSTSSTFTEGGRSCEGH